MESVSAGLFALRGSAPTIAVPREMKVNAPELKKLSVPTRLTWHRLTCAAGSERVRY